MDRPTEVHEEGSPVGDPVPSGEEPPVDKPSGRLLKKKTSAASLDVPPVSSTPSPPVPPPPPPATLGVGGTAKLLLLLVLVGAGAVLWSRRLSETESPPSVHTPPAEKAPPAPRMQVTHRPFSWPPKVGQPCPSAEQLDHKGYPVRLDGFGERVVVILQGGLEDPQTRSLCEPEGLRASLEAGGVDPGDPSLVFVAVLTQDGDAVGLPEAAAWAEEVGLDEWGQAFVLAADDRVASRTGEQARLLLVNRDKVVSGEFGLDSQSELAEGVRSALAVGRGRLCPPEEHPVAEREGAAASAERARWEEKVAGLLGARRFKELERELRAQPDRKTKLRGERSGDEHAALLEAWCKARPNSFNAFLIAGRHAIDHAWEARGGGWAHTVKDSAWPLFRARLERAEKRLERAAQLDPKDAQPHSRLITVAMGRSQGQRRAFEHFRAAIAREDSLGPYLRLMTYLQPRWGGSHEAMQAFATESIERHPGDPSFNWLQIEVCKDLASDWEGGKADFWRKQLGELKPLYAQLAAGDPEAIDVPFVYYDLAQKHLLAEDTAGYWENLKEAAERGGPKSQYAVGVAKLNGKELPLDVPGGLQLICRSAHSGNGKAQSYMGSLYRNGKRIPWDYEQSVHWYELAAKKGFRKARRYAGSLRGGYYFAVSQDLERAAEIFAEGAVEGDAGCKNGLRRLLSRRPWLREGVAREVMVAAGVTDPNDTSWYPRDITPNAQTKYPCEVTALPRELPSLDDVERRYFDRAFAMLLFATQAKLTLMHVMARSDYGDLEMALENYRRDAGLAIRQIKALKTPPGLEPFEKEVLTALALHDRFFSKAVVFVAAERARAGLMWKEQQAAAKLRFDTVLRDVYRDVPEAKQASPHLQAAWGEIHGLYQERLGKAALNSINHHLCAADFF